MICARVFKLFLYTGITFAYLHISGILPSSYDLLKMINNGINISGSQPNQNYVDTSSGPGAFPSSMLLIAAMISSLEISLGIIL